MCRITAIISAEPRNGAGLLFGGPKALIEQAGAVEGRRQDDGWGVGVFAGGKPLVKKSPRPARLERAAFEKAAAAGSRVTLAHLRAASNPSRLPPSRILRMENTQPFSAGGFLFAHNGTLFIKDEIRSLLGAYAGRVKGINDSEVLFWQVMKMLDAYGSPEKAMEMALDEIRTVWHCCRKDHPGTEAPYRGLNMFLASRDSLTVLCHAPVWKSRRDHGALMTPGWQYGRIAWRAERGAAVFSSEPADGGRWRKMNDPEIASARLRGGKLELAFRKVNV